MGRAPNSGAPQRVSAHVVPKAQASFDEDEKTTIESGWEDEASTTVEQGEVAEKIRSLAVDGPLRRGNNTGITSTNGGALDEPTIDDQRANAVLAVITPTVAPARIVVTSGNDKGQELEVRPGKQYTVGRAIDNDFVLTDIAVSRKHFDLRHDNGTWIVVDRGSGNGTVVNGNIEDHPFALMNGDAIEIGNTAFRFDFANQPARARGSFDDEEPSTVAGKPLRGDDLPMPPMPRAKTQPPPAPLPRPRAPSLPPPSSYGPMNGAHGSIPPMPSAAPVGQPISQPMNAQHGGPIGVPMASPTAPTVQPMAGMQAMRGPMAPTMLEPMHPNGMNGHAHAGMNGMLRPQMLTHEGLPGVMPTTIPGQGPPVAPSQPQVMQYGYPNVGELPLHINGGIPRDATSTALVQPVPYGTPMTAHQYSVAQPQPQISKRIKVLLALALLMVVAAIATIAIIRGSSSSEAPKAPVAAKQDPAPEPPRPRETTKVVVPVDEQKKAAEAKRLADEQRQAEEQKQLDEQKQLADQKKADEAKRLEAKKAAEEQKKLAEQAREEALRAEKLEQQKKKKVEPKPEPKPEPRRKTTANVETREPKETPVASSSSSSKKSADPSDVKERALDLYRAKKFNDAAKTLRAALSSVSDSDAGELRSLAAVYEQVGKAYNVGMGPATPPVDAYVSLEKALNLDRTLGVYTDEIKTKLGAVAPKAALKFMADKNYEAAFKAVRVAEANGGKNSTTDLVREGLINAANDLYAAAMEDKGTNPQAARAKLTRVRGMTDKSAILAKAEKAIRELPSR